MKFRTASDRAVIAYLGDSIGAESHTRVVRLLRAIERDRPPWLLNLHPAYCSLLVTFDALAVEPAEVEAALTRLEHDAEAAADEEPRTIEIPVCYGGECGPDLEAVATTHAMTTRQVIEVHSGCGYRAYFLGFAPGFAYLGDVPESIATPRHATPRRSVPAGSVGIAARQTGVYPFATPGGWQLIGRTPLALFGADRAAMSLIALGDRVRFRAITHAEFLAAAPVRAVARTGATADSAPPAASPAAPGSERS